MIDRIEGKPGEPLHVRRRMTGPHLANFFLGGQQREVGVQEAEVFNESHGAGALGIESRRAAGSNRHVAFAQPSHLGHPQLVNIVGKVN